MTTTTEQPTLRPKDLRVPMAPGELHRKIDSLMESRKKKTGKLPNKAKLVTELLYTHPKLKPL
jgi:hypothetical protein